MTVIADDVPTVTHTNLSLQVLLQHAINRKEGQLASNGAFSVETGNRTGRSPKDRFIVQDNLTEHTVDWGAVNQSIGSDIFAALWKKAENFLACKETFTSHLQVGASLNHHLKIKITTETAWHHIFAHHMFIRPEEAFENHAEQWTILHAPSLKTDPIVDGVNSDATLILNFTTKQVVLCGLRYAGEMKKAMFTVMNYILPANDILPMHCAANMDKHGDVALFFGLSGTGKTTLSADPDRFLIGDDEHGWGEEGVFNFEGGCYAKCINLSKEREPVIWDAIRDGAIMENVVLDSNGNPNYDDDSLTQNSRAAYPREFIDMRVKENKGGQPKAVIFLTCDMYGVLPPVARLTKEQAAYHFLSGYTALVGSTEMGHGSGIKPTFSTCFGAPFFPRPAIFYAELLIKRIEATGCKVYLVNTGWTGGSFGNGGKRFDIPVTRSIVHGILNGALHKEDYLTMDGFGFQIPTKLDGVPSELLNPRNNWNDTDAFDKTLAELIQQFKTNFEKFQKISASILNGGPS